MLADFFTKPLRGSLFRKFRSVLLGHAHVNTLRDHATPQENEERVGSENPDGKDNSRTPLTHAEHGASNGASNAGDANAGTGGSIETGPAWYRAPNSNQEEPILNTAHSVEKYPED